MALSSTLVVVAKANGTKAKTACLPSEFFC